jgi:tellurite methyltransferase
MKNNKQVDDKRYWENFYSKKPHPFEPSLFAQYTLKKYLKPGHSLVELGCGNGRDAVYFARQGVRVIAIDQCENEIQFLSDSYRFDHLEFMCGDFTALGNHLRCTHVYSRFTLHSISKQRQADVVSWVYNSLEEEGYFCLEVRGKQNELYGKGTPVVEEPDAFIHDGHYRRFLDLEETHDMLRAEGLEVVESCEERGFSPFGGVDEKFVRIVAQKKGPKLTPKT